MLQEDYEGKKQEGLEHYIKNKMDQVDVEYEYEKADENKIFKTISDSVVDVQSYVVKIAVVGIDYIKPA